MNSWMPEATKEILGLAAEAAQAQRKLLLRLADVNRREGWRYDGATCAESWLVARMGISWATARAWVEVADRLAELPRIASAFEDGALSFDQVRALTRFATPEEDVHLAQHAPMQSVSQLQRQARLRQQARPVADTRDKRSLQWWWDQRQHLFHLRADLAESDGAVVAKTLERLTERLPENPDTHIPAIDQRRADALVQLASQSLGADGDADRATVVLHVDAQVTTGEVENGPTLGPEAIRRLGCDARLEIVLEQDGRAIGIGRASRRIPGWLGRQVRYRDQGCRFPGCEINKWVHAHHLVHWADGGPTDLDNLVTLCGHHHRLVHEHGWRITGDPNRDLDWIRPEGTVYDPALTRIQSMIREIATMKFTLAQPP